MDSEESRRNSAGARSDQDLMDLSLTNLSFKDFVPESLRADYIKGNVCSKLELQSTQYR